MSFQHTSSNKKYILILMAVIALAGVLYVVTGGALDFSRLGKTEKLPTDKEENLAYGLAYRPASDHVLERDGIVLKSFGTMLRAQDLESGVCLDAASIEERSEKPIQRFSEYVGYFYLYDGETVYRTTVSGDKLRATVEDCLKFEPMGDYIYSLKMERGEKKLFRCSIVGTYEKRLFKESVEDFWAYGGNLLLQLEDGRYRWYDVITQETVEHTLPDTAREIALEGEHIFYLAADETTKHTVLYRRPCNLQEDKALPFSSVGDYCAAEGRIGANVQKEDGKNYAAWCQAEGGEVSMFGQKEFSAESEVDISSKHLFVTEPDGTTYYTPLEKEEWSILFDDVG
ncbi:MAG: hypothetical protein HFH53_01590 [Hespellia sp.]|jgi:hypothetical protein|nr:hypothetical protein [Hespellia sp.]